MKLTDNILGLPEKSARKKRAFTLIELLVALSCFSLIMFALMAYLAAAQRAWSLASGNCSIYENAQFAFEIIGKDLQSAVASNRTGEEIPFAYTSTQKLAFVGCLSPNNTADRELCVISYNLTNNQLCRDLDYSDTSFFGNTGWTGSTATGSLISGVKDFSVTCYGENPDPGNASDPTGYKAGIPHTSIPYAAMVSITLYDEKITDPNSALVNQSLRTFSRLFFIGGGTGTRSIR